MDRSSPKTVILTESAIDAISAWSIEDCCRPGTVILSTAGVARRLPTWAEAWRPKRILVAFDADPVGDRAAERLLSEDRRARRMRPPDGHEERGPQGTRQSILFQERARNDRAVSGRPTPTAIK